MATEVPAAIFSIDDKHEVEDCIGRLEGLFADLTSIAAPSRLTHLANELLRREAAGESSSALDGIISVDVEEQLRAQRDELERSFHERLAAARESSFAEGKAEGKAELSDRLSRLQRASEAADARAQEAIASADRAFALLMPPSAPPARGGRGGIHQQAEAVAAALRQERAELEAARSDMETWKQLAEESVTWKAKAETAETRVQQQQTRIAALTAEVSELEDSSRALSLAREELVKLRAREASSSSALEAARAELAKKEEEWKQSLEDATKMGREALEAGRRQAKTERELEASQWSGRMGGMEEANGQLKHQIAQLREELRMKDLELDTLRKEAEAVTSPLLSMSDEEVRALKDFADAQRRRAEAADEQLRRQTTELGAVRRELEASKGVSIAAGDDRLQKRCSALESALSDAEEQLEEMEDHLGQANDKVQRLQNKLQETEAALKTLKDSRRAAVLEGTRSGKDALALTAENERLQAELSALDVRCRRLQADLQQARSDATRAQQEADEARAEAIDAAKKSFAAARPASNMRARAVASLESSTRPQEDEGRTWVAGAGPLEGLTMEVEQSPVKGRPPPGGPPSSTVGVPPKVRSIQQAAAVPSPFNEGPISAPPPEPPRVDSPGGDVTDSPVGGEVLHPTPPRKSLPPLPVASPQPVALVSPTSQLSSSPRSVPNVGGSTQASTSSSSNSLGQYSVSALTLSERTASSSRMEEPKGVRVQRGVQPGLTREEEQEDDDESMGGEEYDHSSSFGDDELEGGGRLDGALTGTIGKQSSRVIVTGDTDEGGDGGGFKTMPPADDDDEDGDNDDEDEYEDEEFEAVQRPGAERRGVDSSVSSVLSDVEEVIRPDDEPQVVDVSAHGSPDLDGSQQAMDLSNSWTFANEFDSVEEWTPEDVAVFLEEEVGVGPRTLQAVRLQGLTGKDLVSLTERQLQGRLALRSDSDDWIAIQQALGVFQSSAD
jgi:colicin import membrane protein